MKNSMVLGSAFGAAVAAALACSTPALAIETGCYPADVVRNATWLAEGPEKQFTIIAGERNNDLRHKNFFTSSADGSIGYNIEGSGNTNDGQSDQLCIAAKYQNVRVSTEAARPSWVRVPAGSSNDKYLSVQAQKYQTRVIFGASTIVRGKDGLEYAGPQLIVTQSGTPVDGMTVGGVITNDRSGEGNALFAMVNLRTNANFDALAKAQRVQNASLAANFR